MISPSDCALLDRKICCFRQLCAACSLSFTLRAACFTAVVERIFVGCLKNSMLRHSHSCARSKRVSRCRSFPLHYQFPVSVAFVCIMAREPDSDDEWLRELLAPAAPTRPSQDWADEWLQELLAPTASGTSSSSSSLAAAAGAAPPAASAAAAAVVLPMQKVGRSESERSPPRAAATACATSGPAGATAVLAASTLPAISDLPLQKKRRLEPEFLPPAVADLPRTTAKPDTRMRVCASKMQNRNAGQRACYLRFAATPRCSCCCRSL